MLLFKFIAGIANDLCIQNARKWSSSHKGSELYILREDSSNALFKASSEREALQSHPESILDKSTHDPDSKPAMETLKAHHIWSRSFMTSIPVSLGNFHQMKRCNISTLWITNACSEGYYKNQCKLSSAKQMQRKETTSHHPASVKCKELQIFCIILNWGNFKGAIFSLLDLGLNLVCCSAAPRLLAAQSC